MKMKTTSARRWSAIVALLGLPAAAGTALADSPADIPEEKEFRLPVDADTAAEIDTLIPQLGSPKYATREAASGRLLEIGPVALAKLRQAYLTTDDLESRLRIETIVEDAYLTYHVYGRNGFLGIGQGLIVTHEDDRRIAKGHVGVTVSSVILETAAQRAGLREFDVIIAMDDNPIAATGSQREIATDFGESIRLRGPGTAVKLTVLRDGSVLQVNAVLGRRGRSHYWRFDPMTQEPDAPTRMLILARQRFEPWWIQHFRKRPGTTARP